MEFLPQAFEILRFYPQFIIYQLIQSKKRIGKIDKLPIDYRTQKLSKTGALDPQIWLNSDDAILTAKKFGNSYGVGFVLTKNDPFFFLDIDNCLTPENEWSPIASTLMMRLSGAAMEISSSGKGIHILGTGFVPSHDCKNINAGLELYTEQRFVALTGTQVLGSMSFDCSTLLPEIISKYFSKSQKSQKMTTINWTNSPRAEWNGSSDDIILLERMLRSRSSASIFSGKTTFKDLWENNIENFITYYPDTERDHGYDMSSVDAALAQHLAFWTGNDCERMRSFMMKSQLVRDKWEREDYLVRTILHACSKQKEWLNDKPILSSENTTSPTIALGTKFLTLDNQLKLFQGCIYISDAHKILIPNGQLLNMERFRVKFGGHSFPMDNENGRVVKNAWEAFTESQAISYPKVDSSTFRPDLAPGEILNKDGQTLVNVYVPIKTLRIKGDPSPFLNHIEKLFSDPKDQIIIISYMAATIRYLGTKFRWCPLIQGIEGNGKTFLTLCIAFAIGDRYTHFPKAQEIGAKFNDWMFGKCFIGVEDIFDGRREIMEALKIMITGERQEIEPKGGAKTTQDICCNFLINTNHKDGLRKHRGDRRIAPFHTKQQYLEDFRRDGMTGDYFYNLYSWARKHQGLAIIADYLDNFDIPEEFNPATRCERAPITSSTETAILAGMTHAEQEILEAIEQEQLGFKKGWISSIMLDNLLMRVKANWKIPLNKRRDLLKSIGYDWHPGLTEGRVNNTVMPDGGKPRLFIKQEHITKDLRNAADIAKRYAEDQI